MNGQDEAKMTMLLYCGLTPGEEQRLQAIDTKVADTITKKKATTARPVWTACDDECGRRLLRLTVGSPPQELMFIPAQKAMELDDDKLLENIESWLDWPDRHLSPCSSPESSS